MENTRVRLGLRLPATSQADPHDAAGLVERCGALGIALVEVEASWIEQRLGAPAAPAVLELPDHEGFETGMLPLEEEILQDEIDLARATVAARLRAWRREASLVPLGEVRRAFADAGVAIASVRWPGFAPLDRETLDHVVRVTAASGASAISADCTGEVAGRLTQRASAAGVAVGVTARPGAIPRDEDGAPGVAAVPGVIVDVGAWTAAGVSPLPFLERHARQVMQVYVSDCRGGRPAALGEGDAPIREVLRGMRERAWPFPAIVVAPGDDGHRSGAAGPLQAAARALDYCRRGLTS